MRGQETNTNQTRNTTQKQSKNPHKQTNKTGHNPKTARSVISWSVHSHLKRIRRDNIVSPLGLVWQNKSRANNKARKCHTAICEPGSNKKHNGETEAPPSQEPRDHRVLAARATFQKPAMTLRCGKRKV